MAILALASLSSFPGTASAANPAAQVLTGTDYAVRVADRSSSRQGIVQALSQIKQRYGGNKIGQHWDGDRLLVPWIDRDGQRLLFEIDPQSGAWRRR